MYDPTLQDSFETDGCGVEMKHILVCLWLIVCRIFRNFDVDFE